MIEAILAASLGGLAFAGGCSKGSASAGPDDAGFEATASSGSDGFGDDSGNGLTLGSDAPSMSPPPPALGTQIDRAGRPAITLALNGTFDPTCTTTTCPAKDTYNANAATGTWGADYDDGFAAYLAIYDGLDGVCGNQPGYTAAAGYATLASLLADDRLWLDTGSTTCAQYLAVELGGLGVPSTDCGGRTPTENPLDLTYNLMAGTLAAATLPGNPGPATNGIDAPSSAVSTAFPYLAAPH